MGALIVASRGRGLTKLRQATACQRKDRFEDEDAARARMRKVIAEGDAAPGSLNVYRCRVCKGWHVGHTPEPPAGRPLIVRDMLHPLEPMLRGV